MTNSSSSFALQRLTEPEVTLHYSASPLGGPLEGRSIGMRHYVTKEFLESGLSFEDYAEAKTEAFSLWDVAHVWQRRAEEPGLKEFQFKDFGAKVLLEFRYEDTRGEKRTYSSSTVTIPTDIQRDESWVLKATLFRNEVIEHRSVLIDLTRKFLMAPQPFRQFARHQADLWLSGLTPKDEPCLLYTSPSPRDS